MWNRFDFLLFTLLTSCEFSLNVVNCIRPLGLESGFIPDEALSHSVDTANTKSNPTDIRLNKDVGEFPNGWQAALGELDYLQVIIFNERL